MKQDKVLNILEDDPIVHLTYGSDQNNDDILLVMCESRVFIYTIPDMLIHQDISTFDLQADKVVNVDVKMNGIQSVGECLPAGDCCWIHSMVCFCKIVCL